MTIRKGDRVFFKPEFSEPTDEKYVYVACCDAEDGRVIIMATNTTLAFPPQNMVKTSMLVGGDA